MAIMDNTQRADAAEKFVRAYFVGLAKTSDLDSAEVRTLINDLDTWLDANATAANNAISPAIRAKASQQTKFAAVGYVALKRAGII